MRNFGFAIIVLELKRFGADLGCRHSSRVFVPCLCVSCCVRVCVVFVSCLRACVVFVCLCVVFVRACVVLCVGVVFVSCLRVCVVFVRVCVVFVSCFRASCRVVCVSCRVVCGVVRRVLRKWFHFICGRLKVA